MQELTRVPASNLRRYYVQLVGRPPNHKRGMSTVQQEKWLPLVKEFVPKTRGPAGYFLRDEEELFVITLEEAFRAAFPYDTDMLERMATNAGKGIYGKDFKVGVKWRVGFEKRWRDRLTTLKCGSIDRARGKKATSEVRDAVFKKFKIFLKTLVDEGKFTQDQVDNLQKHLANCDEVGGDERGKSKKRVYACNNAAAGSWRATDTAGDHEPFHVTLMLTSLAIGIIASAVQVIHSCPGVVNPRMSSELYDGLPGHWSCCRTSSGSQTRETFEDWTAYFVRTMTKKGWGTQNNKPMILLIDGHTSRWTYDGLQTLINAGIYPFFIASHTSAWHQPNGQSDSRLFFVSVFILSYKSYRSYPMGYNDRNDITCLPQFCSIYRCRPEREVQSSVFQAMQVSCVPTDSHNHMISPHQEMATNKSVRPI